MILFTRLRIRHHKERARSIENELHKLLRARRRAFLHHDYLSVHLLTIRIRQLRPLRRRHLVRLRRLTRSLNPPER